MSKFADLASIASAPLASFVYLPPTAAMKAARILVLANLGYAAGAAPALNWGTLAAVLRGLRRASPFARILIVDRLCPASSADAVFDRIGLRESLDDEMRAAATDTLLMREYDNPLPTPQHYSRFTAPQAVDDFDCVIVIGTADVASAASGSVPMLRHLLPCQYTMAPDDVDVFMTFARHIDAAVVEVRLHRDETRIFTSSDLLALDEAAFRALGSPPPEWHASLRALRRCFL